MVTPVSARYLIIECDDQGVICAIYQDDLGITQPQTNAQSFVTLTDPGSTVKAIAFLNEVQRQRLVFAWELYIATSSQPLLLYFSGIRLKESSLLVGTMRRSDLVHHFSKVIPAQQTGVAGESLDEQEIQEWKREPTDEEFYNEISQLNNELLTAQRQLLQKNIELKRLLEQKNELLGMVAHDLRNPLSGIEIYAKLLLENEHEPLTNEQIELVSTIHEQSTSMFRLVNSLLSTSRL